MKTPTTPKIAADSKHIVKISKITGNKIYGFDFITEKLAVIDKSEAVFDPEWLSNGLFKKKTIALIAQFFRGKTKESRLFDMFNFNERTYRRHLKDYCHLNFFENWENACFSDKYGTVYEITGKYKELFYVKFKTHHENVIIPSFFSHKDGFFSINERKLNELVADGVLNIIPNE